MTQAEQQKVFVMNALLTGSWTMAEAATVLGRSERQVRRLLAAYRDQGVAALVHGNRGRTPAHALDEPTRQRVRDLAAGRYAGFNDTHLTEHLVGQEDLAVGRDRLRHLLDGERLGSAIGLAQQRSHVTRPRR